MPVDASKIRIAVLPRFSLFLEQSSMEAAVHYERSMLNLPFVYVCSICGVIPPHNTNHHLCQHPETDPSCRPPHEQMFVVEEKRPLYFCKAFQGADIWPYVERMAKLYARLYTSGFVLGGSLPAAHVVELGAAERQVVVFGIWSRAEGAEVGKFVGDEMAFNYEVNIETTLCHKDWSAIDTFNKGEAYGRSS